MSSMGSDFVREARKRAGLTQSELADKAGTTQSAIARLESGRTQPGFDAVLRLVRLCGMDLDIMLSERDDSDWAQARAQLLLTPADRIRRMEDVARQMLKIREAGAVARAARRSEGAA